jgi:DNA-binding transcriptional ArsR family regulator
MVEPVNRRHILNSIRDFYLRSSDFNGILASALMVELGLSWPKVRQHLKALVRDQLITLVFGSHSINPHIKRIADLPPQDQLAKLDVESPESFCAYPARSVIQAAVNVSAYDDRPFTKGLLLAEPQLTPVFFELNVLDSYYRDPRYHFDFRDYEGSISITSEHYASNHIREKDKVLLETFGIGYDSSRSFRVVVVFLRYLSRLSPQHQQLWNAHTICEPCIMNSDYESATIWAAWPRYYSVYKAFCQEQVEINKLAAMIGKPGLFRRTFERKRPDGFAPMLRPTLKNFHEFVHTLDKMLSENINLDFFEGDVPLQTRTAYPDGHEESGCIPTLQALETWLSQRYTSKDGADIARELVAPFREVRRRRSNAAHALQDNDYDPSLPKTQDELLDRVCRALTSLRLVFSSHPGARDYSPPVWLDGDRIVFY